MAKENGRDWLTPEQFDKRVRYYQETFVNPHLRLKEVEEEARRKIPGIVNKIRATGKERAARRLENEKANRKKWADEDTQENMPQIILDLLEEFSKRQPNHRMSRRAIKHITKQLQDQILAGLGPDEIMNGWGPSRHMRRTDYIEHPRTRRLIRWGNDYLFNSVAYEEEDIRAGIIPEPENRKKRKR